MTREELQTIANLVNRAPLANMPEALQVAALLERFSDWCDEICSFDDADNVNDISAGGTAP